MSIEHDEFGREIPDPVPIEVPLHLRRPVSLEERIRDAVRQAASEEARAQGLESWDEADDFTWGEDDEYVSPYEMSEMQPDSPAGEPLAKEPGDEKEEPAVEPTKVKLEKKVEGNVQKKAEKKSGSVTSEDPAT